MYPDLPIQQLLRRNDTRFQFGFARQARTLIPARGEFVLTASREGLRVLGRNEDALRGVAGGIRAAELLRGALRSAGTRSC